MSAKRTYEISGLVLERVKEFEKNHKCTLPDDPKNPGHKKTGAIGGGLTYSFTPTSLGTAIKIKCACGQEKDATDYDSW